MDEHGSLPRARQDGLLVETVGEELLIYDRDSHTAHCLRPIAACVWSHCDGKRDVTELAGLAGAREDLVADALQGLREKDLLEAEPDLVQSTVPSISRREAIVRGVRYGATAAAVPLIVSATAATPAMASSGEGTLEATVEAEEGELAQMKVSNPFSFEIEITKAPTPFAGKGAVTSNGTCTVGKRLAVGGSCKFSQNKPTGAFINWK